MFTIDQNITYQKIKEKDMTKAFFSMNNHQIATPEMMLEDARSYIMFFHETGGKLSAYIGLHLLQSGRKLFYAHSSNPFQTGEMESVEEEALGFVEGLGGLLDAVDFTKMSSEEKNRWIENQDLFIEKPEPESSAEEKPEEAEQEKASSVQPEPQAPQTPSSAPEPALEMQLPPQMQPAPPQQYAPQPQQAPPIPDMPQSQQVTQAPLVRQVPPMQYAPQAPQQLVPPVQYVPQTSQQQPSPPAAPMQYTPQVPQQAPPMQYAPQAPQTPPALPVQPAPEMQTQHAPVPQNQEYRGSEAQFQIPIHEQGPYPPAQKQPPVQKAPLGDFDEMHSKPNSRAAGRAASPVTPPKDRQEILQKAIKAGVVKGPKQSIKKEAQSAVGVVSRDREALARLLTSF